MSYSTLGKIALTALVLWFLIPFLPLLFGLDGPSSLNELGDSYGGVTSLFSAAAFLGVVYSLFLQREEISASSEEVKKQSAMLATQTQALKDAVEAQKQQAENLHAQIAELGRSAAASEEQANYLSKQVYEQGYMSRRHRFDAARARLLESGKLGDMAKSDGQDNREVRALLGDDYLAASKALLAYLDRLPEDVRRPFLGEIRDDLSDAEQNALFNAEFRNFPDNRHYKSSALAILLARHQMVGTVPDTGCAMRRQHFLDARKIEPA